MKNLVEILLSKKWLFSWDRRMTYQKIRLFSYAYQHVIPKMFSVSSGSELYRIKNSIVSGFNDLSEHSTVFAAIEKQFLNKQSVKLFAALVEFIKVFEQDFKNFIEKMPNSYAKRTNEELLKDYLDYCKVEYNISLPTWVLFAPFEEIITKTLRLALEKEFGNQKKADEILEKLSLPQKITPLDIHDKTLYKIALAQKSKRRALLINMANKFIHWGQFDVNYPEATPQTFIEKLHKLEDLNVKKLLVELDNKYKQRERIAKLVLKEFENNRYIHELANLYIHYANYKDWKNYYREFSSYKLKILLNEISKRIGLTLEQTAFLTEEETVKALRDKGSFNAKEIEKRIKDSALVFIKGQLFIIIDKKSLNKIDQILSPSKVMEVKGTAVYPGKVKGFVRIIISSDDFKKLKVNDILVTSTTRPDFVPIMKKAAAFVTNEGGLLSHAAIVARELKKPCVIGTKLSTKIFKDGDMVEVDANNGIVRLVSRKALNESRRVRKI